MLSLLPQILFLSPFAPTLLRFACGATFVYLAYKHYANRKIAAEELSSLVSGAGIILPVYCLIELAVGASLIAGAWTQAAAIVGCIIALKMLLVRGKLRELKPISELSYAFLAIMCLSLVVTGAGALAFDLPL